MGSRGGAYLPLIVLDCRHAIQEEDEKPAEEIKDRKGKGQGLAEEKGCQD